MGQIIPHTRTESGTWRGFSCHNEVTK